MKFDAKNNVIEKTNVQMNVLGGAIIRDEGKFNLPNDKVGEYWMLEQGLLPQAVKEIPVVLKKEVNKEAPVKKEEAPAPSIKKPARKPRRK